MNERDSELLQLALSGDLPRGSPELARALARRPDLARRLEELEAVGKGLDTLADDEAAAIGRARAGTTERDRRAVVDAFWRARNGSAVANGSGPDRRALVWRLAVVAAIAATILVVALTALRIGPEPSKAPTFLASQSLRIVAPGEGDGRWDEIRWEGGPTRGPFKVTLELETPADPSDRVLAASPWCTERRWKPSDEDLARLPDRFRIVVCVLDGNGFELSSTSVSASRSR